MHAPPKRIGSQGNANSKLSNSRAADSISFSWGRTPHLLRYGAVCSSTHRKLDCHHRVANNRPTFLSFPTCPRKACLNLDAHHAGFLVGAWHRHASRLNCAQRILRIQSRYPGTEAIYEALRLTIEAASCATSNVHVSGLCFGLSQGIGAPFYEQVCYCGFNSAAQHAPVRWSSDPSPATAAHYSHHFMCVSVWNVLWDVSAARGIVLRT